MKLNRTYYTKDNVIEIAKDLIGKVIYTQKNNKITAGIITETEAYNGVIDKACHAYNNKRTKRTETMYLEGGVCYVYLCYGIHHLFNIVTSQENDPKAVLIRGIQPIEGISIMLERRKKNKFTNKCNNGPGKIAVSLGIDTEFNRTSLLSNKVWIEDKGHLINKSDILVTKRVGIDYAEEDALLPYRFLLK